MTRRGETSNQAASPGPHYEDFLLEHEANLPGRLRGSIAQPFLNEGKRAGEYLGSVESACGEHFGSFFIISFMKFICIDSVFLRNDLNPLFKHIRISI